MSQPSSEDTISTSPYTKALTALVVLVILALVTFKLTTPPGQPVADNTPALEENIADVLPEHSMAPAPENNPSASAEETIISASAKIGPDVKGNTEQDKKEIHQFIKDWQSAWQKSAGPNGTLETLFALYSDSYTYGQLNKSQWQNSKKIRNQGKSWIEVWISDIRITKKSHDSYRVTFRQEYSSSNYSDKGNKELIIVKNGPDWTITSEKSL